MSFFVAGTGASVPQLKIENSRFEQIMDTSDEWITTRTGIKTRSFLDKESLTDIAVNSAVEALKKANITALNLDLIICATLQGEYIMPGLACMVQARLQASCPSMDINAACTGFLYSLDIADSYFTANKAENILIICADHMSKFLDFSDRATSVLFGDGAGAVILKKGNGLKFIKINAIGDNANLYIKGKVGKLPFGSNKNPQEDEGSFLKMNGQNVFKFAVSTVTNDIRFALKYSKIKSNEISYFLLHQANIRILEMSQIFLKEPKEKFPENLNLLGNTSAASIPILLDELNVSNKLKKGDKILLSAFGGGMTSGTAIIEWN